MKADELFALLRRRGVLWPSAEVYGGVQGFFDYGPLGAALKRQVEEAWAAWFLGLSDDYYRIEPSEVLPEAVVRASGHLENFTDPEVRCTSCHSSFRADALLEKWRPDGVDGLSPIRIGEMLKEHTVHCPNCGKSTLAVPQPFNLMFRLDLGATGGERGYLRPETAQNAYLAFNRMWDVGRHALPLGVAVIGRVYRNEISPRQVLYRMRSFTQAELQIFFDPDHFDLPWDEVSSERMPVLRASDRAQGAEAAREIPASDLVTAGGIPRFYAYHLVQSFRFYRDVLKFPAASIRLYEKSEEERAFYNRIQFDIEVDVPTLGGFREVGAVHYRGDYDLRRHSEGAGKDLSVQPVGRASLVPHVLELTFGVDRALWALADRGLHVDGERTVWSLPAYLAPVQAAVFPHVAKAHAEFARELARRLRDAGLRVAYDERGSIGRRYARQDEAGTPACITIDDATVQPGGPEAGTVTLRDRETRAQDRVPADHVAARLLANGLFPRPRTA